MKWILYLGNDSWALIDAFKNHGNGKSFSGILFPESAKYRSDKLSLTNAEQIDVLNQWIDINKEKMKDEFVFATHSEFFFLAFRHAVWSNKIDSKDVEIRWLSGSKDNSYTVLSIDEDGRINNWPSDMFSETERLLADLLGPKPVAPIG